MLDIDVGIDVLQALTFDFTSLTYFCFLVALEMYILEL